MKLEELKVALIQQFFKSCDNGITQDAVSAVFESLGKKLNSDVTQLSEQPTEVEESEHHSGSSCEPSKAFRKFVDGRRALLTINEDNSGKKMALFAAIRVGTEVMYSDLTTESREEVKGDLTVIKQALRQAKNINDDIYFNIQTDD